MASTQYIGARYVPLLYTNPDDNTNNWKSGVVYDPLTVVTDLNQSYTSKIPVPATVGRPSENPAYWVLTGSYNAQIAALSASVADLQSSVTETEEDITEINDYLETKNEYILFVTDSYGVSSDGINAFPAILNNYGLSKFVKAWDYTAVAGSAFAPWPNQKNFTDQLVDYNNTDMIGKITHIIAIGGTNDAKLGLTTETETGLNSFVSTAIGKFTALKKISILYVAHVNGVTYNQPNTLATYNTFKAFNPAANIDYCFYNAINMFSWTNLRNDGVHPNQTGQNQLASGIVRFITTGSIKYYTDFINVSGEMREGWNMYLSMAGEYSYLIVQVIATNQPDVNVSGAVVNFSQNDVVGIFIGYDIVDLKLMSAWFQIRKDGSVLGSAWTPPNNGRYNIHGYSKIAIPTAMIQSV